MPGAKSYFAGHVGQQERAKCVEINTYPETHTHTILVVLILLSIDTVIIYCTALIRSTRRCVAVTEIDLFLR